MPVDGLILDTTAIAAVALVGYLFGRRTRRATGAAGSGEITEKIDRAQRIAVELQRIAESIRREVASHQGSIAGFREQVCCLRADADSAQWHELGTQAESLLSPTLKLASKLSTAYDELRKQSTQLMAFAGTRIDAESGVYNRRAMDEQLGVLQALNPRQPGQGYCLALVTASPYGQDSDGAHESAPLGPFARLLEACARDTDFVARYSSDEFAVLMPRTPLAGAMAFSERVLRRAGEELSAPIWMGVVQSSPGDEDGDRLLSRAESALYSARTVDEACIFKHDGRMVRRHSPAAPTVVMPVEHAVPAPIGAEE